MRASPHHSLDLGGQAAAIGALGCLAAAIIEWWHSRLEQSMGSGRLCGLRCSGCGFCISGTARQAAHASAFAVSTPTVRADVSDRPAGERGLLRPHLRAEPVLPADQRPVTSCNRSGLSSDDGSRAAGELVGRARNRAIRRPCHHRHRRNHGGRGIHGTPWYGLREPFLPILVSLHTAPMSLHSACERYPHFAIRRSLVQTRSSRPMLDN